MCTLTIGDGYRGYSIAPFLVGSDLREEIVGKENDSLAINVQSRLLFLAQIICSIVALPLTLLATIVFPVIAFCVEGKEAAWRELVRMGAWEVLHLCMIPTALIAFFMPHEKGWNEPVNSLMNIQWLDDCLNKAETAYENRHTRESSRDSNDFDERAELPARN